MRGFLFCFALPFFFTSSANSAVGTADIGARILAGAEIALQETDTDKVQMTVSSSRNLHYAIEASLGEVQVTGEFVSSVDKNSEVEGWEFRSADRITLHFE